MTKMYFMASFPDEQQDGILFNIICKARGANMSHFLI